MDVPTKPSLDQAPPMPDIAADDDVAKLLDRYVSGTDERLMRAVEWLMGVPATSSSDARREIMDYVGALSIEGKKLAPGMNKRLDDAIEKLLVASK